MRSLTRFHVSGLLGVCLSADWSGWYMHINTLQQATFKNYREIIINTSLRMLA